MAWSYNVNNSAGTGSDVIFALKTLLKAAGWTVRMSGGGTGSILYSSTGEIITTAGQMNGALSWFVIQQPVAVGHPQREFLFKHKANISGDPAYDIRVSAAGGYSAAGTDEDTEPAATADAQLIAGSALSAGGVGLFPADGTYKYHMGCEGADPWGWYMIWSKNGSGNAVQGVVFDPLVAGTFPASDADPAVYNASTDSTVSGTFGSGLYTSGSRQSKYWFKKGLAGETWCSYANGFNTGFAFNYDVGAAGVAIPGSIGANPHSSKYEHFPIMWGRGTSFATAVGWKGIGSVQRWRGAVLVDFDTLSVAGVRERVVAELVTLPWPDVAPVL